MQNAGKHRDDEEDVDDQKASVSYVQLSAHRDMYEPRKTRHRTKPVEAFGERTAIRTTRGQQDPGFRQTLI